MPRLDGRQVAPALKTHPVLKSIPIVVLTTSGQETDVDGLYAIGGNSYLSSYWLERASLPSPL